ncbi:MAG: hypothetical protein RI945_344 [Candidatus Parcubacteria bacterium]|jgi:hypothetical protein
MSSNKNKIIKILLLITILLILVLSFVKLLEKDKVAPPNNNPATTTIINIPSSWLTQDDTVNNFSFRYPENFNTTYIHTVDWPPQAYIQNKSFSCTEGGTSVEVLGSKKIKVINGHTYCVTEASEGAAGSIYINYTYNTMIGNKNLLFAFSIREPQCMNYDEPSQSGCKNEEANFNIDPIIDKVIQSLLFK